MRIGSGFVRAAHGRPSKQENPIESLLEVLEETPLWVYLLFVFLCITGWRSSKKRTLSLTQLWLLPALFTVWSFHALVEQWQSDWIDGIYWLFCLGLGSAAGWCLVRRWKIDVDRKRRRITLPGSWSTLALSLLIFAVRYGFGYYYATHVRISHEIFLADLVLSSFIAGIFIGKALYFLCKYRTSDGYTTRGPKL